MTRLWHIAWSAYRLKWSLVRLGLAVFALWVVAADTEARLARSALRMMTDVDLAAEVHDLRLSGRFGEAISVAEQAMTDESLPASTRDALKKEHDLATAERSSWLRRFKDVGMGAISGRGETLESLAGVVAADLLVVGDVRDLVLQGSRYMADGEADPVILSLSVIGLATTLAPEIDWVPSLFKAGTKAGAISRRMGEVIIESAKARKFERLAPLWKDTRRIVEHTSPASTMRLLRHTDGPEDVAKLAAFLERSPRGSVALHLTKGQGVAWVKTVGAEGDKILLLAARKGERGAAWLASGAGRLLLKPHPLVGLAKGLYKGNVSALIERVLDRMGPDSWWVLPLCAGWVLVEGLVLSRRVGRWKGSRIRLDAA
jgi:hypothetical protein